LILQTQIAHVRYRILEDNMYLPIFALVISLFAPAYLYAADQSQTPDTRPACCQMHGNHGGHGGHDGNDGGCACCAGAEAACAHCQNGNGAECCQNGTCKDGCCKDGCCKDPKETACAGCEAGCCKKDAPKR
jgi:hypothetical protein